MLKVMWYPIWRITKLENKLADYEKQGYILEKVILDTWFVFREKKSNKCANYFLTKKGFRYNDSMGHWDYALLSNHNASVTTTRFCKYNFYRLTEDAEKSSFLRESRVYCFRGRIIENLIYFSIMCALFLLLFFLSDDHIKYLYLIISILNGILDIINFIGLVILIKEFSVKKNHIEDIKNSKNL